MSRKLGQVGGGKLPKGVYVLRAPPSQPAAQGQHEVQHGARLDVVVADCLLVRHLAPSEDEPLLLWGDALLLLHLFLHPLDLVVGVDVDLDLFAGQGLDLDKHVVPRWWIVRRSTKKN
eukprot:EG_transcript_49802